MRRFMNGMVLGWLILGVCMQAHGQAVPPGWFNVKSYGAQGDGTHDDTAAIKAAIAAAAAPAGGGAQGAVVYFPTGQYEISSTVVLPNRVALQGSNSEGSVIQAMSSFTGTWMFQAYNQDSHGNPAPEFGSRIQDMVLDFNDLNIPNSAIIEADSWQENCGLDRVLLMRFRQYGMIIAHGYGGAAYLPLKDIQVFGSSYGSLVGIKVGQIGAYGGFILAIDGGTFAGGNASDSNGNLIRAAPLPIGIQLQDSLVAKGLHFEQTTLGISHYGNGGLSVDTVTGASGCTSGCSIPGNPPTGVGRLIELGATFTGMLNARNLIGNGMTTPLIINNVTGVNISGGGGHNLAQYALDLQSPPASTPNSVLY